jgi:hypothetical protein
MSDTALHDLFGGMRLVSLYRPYKDVARNQIYKNIQSRNVSEA